MFPTASYPIYADRYVAHSDYIDVVGYDFTGATFDMEVRDSRNGGLVRATVVPTVSVTIDEGVPTSRVSWSIGAATMTAMPLNAEPQNNHVLYYDLTIDPTTGEKFVAWRGTFTVIAGVTQ